MAGGRGERMRASGVELPKPLVPVAGVPLIDWNLRALLRRGFDDIIVAVPPEPASVAEYVERRLQPAAAAAGARLRLLRETSPLGNIGCAGALHGQGDVLVVYADNVTALDLGELVEHHRAARAALTLAVHDEPFRLPYGRLALEGERVVAYDEKPEVAVAIASGVAVLGPDATAALPGDRPTGIADLANELLGRGLPVAAHRHDAAWVDVNDASALPRAAALVERHPDAFAPGSG
jgi:NDP-sugar pyrophosphorylase family protein